MARDLADPSFEPSDDDLRELARHASEDARAQRRRVDEALRAQIAAARAEALATLTRPRPAEG